MLRSFSEFKFYQSFRIPVEKADNLRFLVETENDLGKTDTLNDASLMDISLTGLGFSTKTRLSVGTALNFSFQFKKQYLDLTGTVVRAFSNTFEDKEIIYGVEIDEDHRLKKFLEHYILSFSNDRLKDCLIHSALKESYTEVAEGFEVFSLLLSLFKDISQFKDKKKFVDGIIEEVVRVMNAHRATIFLINPSRNELESYSAMGLENGTLKFDYRLGIAGSVFTTGVALNIDTKHDQSRFYDAIDKKTGFNTKSIICHPIHNREDKIIGVIEVLNKKNQDRFSLEDEKIMKVLSLVFSSVFHDFNPMTDSSKIRRFSTPFDRQFVMIGDSTPVRSLRSTISKIKDIDSPALVFGEKGVGKELYAKIIHTEGQRGVKPLEVIDCLETSVEDLQNQLWGPDDVCKLSKCQGGTLILKEISALNMDFQIKLKKIFRDLLLPDRKLSLDVRLICTSSKDLGHLVDIGKFEKELFEFISEIFITIVPLRRRTDDIKKLVDYFLRMECKKRGLLLKSFSPRAMGKLIEHDWPGNIGELRKCVERAVLYNPKSHLITEEELGNPSSPLFDVNVKNRIFGDLPFVSDFHVSLKDRIAIVEREMILQEIKRNNGNKSKAAKEMGISREALRKKLIQSDDILKSLEKDKSEANGNATDEVKNEDNLKESA